MIHKNVFVKKLYSIIDNEDNKILKCVKWDRHKKNTGFSIINYNTFHEKCLENKVTKSNNFKSLNRQLNNYGFKYCDGFWYHNKNYFFKNSKFLYKIRYKEYLKVNSEKIIKKYTKKNKIKFNFKNNNVILNATQKFLYDELFNSIEFNIKKDDREFLYNLS